MALDLNDGKENIRIVVSHFLDQTPAHSALLRDAVSGRWLLFEDPIDFFQVRRRSDLRPALAALEEAAVSRSLYVVAWLSYEAGVVFDEAFTVSPDSSFPLAGIATYRRPRILENLPAPTSRSSGTPWHAAISAQRYREAFYSLRRHLARGNSYQVNFSFPLEATLSVPPEMLFADMIAAQPVGYGAFLNFGQWSVCCASPELFFSLDGTTIVCKPMKGTARRGRWTAEDLAIRDELATSSKAHAENIMIVDMVRNDLSKIARTGSVTVPRLFEPERYPTVWQLTSTVTAQTDASLIEIFSALCPPASITGAPKAKTMQIISDLEGSPRRIYTGTIGFVTPERRAQFNVAIRTVLINNATSRAAYRVGSGIVWDSDPEAEYFECLDKAKVLTETRRDFELLETIGWDPVSGYRHLDRHVERLGSSAEFFGRPFAPDDALKLLVEHSAGWKTRMRVRLMADIRGSLRVEAHRLIPLPETYRVRLAQEPVNSNDVFLFHKTTERSLYNKKLSEVGDADDAVLFNQDGEITESCIGNIVLQISGKLYTPPLESGCLPGIGRAQLLNSGTVIEKRISLDEFADATKILIVNSARGVWEARRLPKLNTEVKLSGEHVKSQL